MALSRVPEEFTFGIVRNGVGSETAVAAIPFMTTPLHLARCGLALAVTLLLGLAIVMLFGTIIRAFRRRFAT